MSTPLTDSINALTQYANETTGKQDTTLSDAVGSLVEGYGGGSDSEKEQLLQVLDRTVTRIDAPSITTLGYMAFNSCTNLKYVRMDNLETTTGSHTFNGCPIEEAHFPKLKTVCIQFITSDKLRFLALPMANGLGNTAVKGTLLEAIDIGGVSDNIKAGNFMDSVSLTTIVLRRNTVIPLQRLNEIETTPFGANGTGGTLYVPQSLIPSYQSANVWNTLFSYPNNQILPIEGSIYETQYVDGTPVT